LCNPSALFAATRQDSLNYKNDKISFITPAINCGRDANYDGNIRQNQLLGKQSKKESLPAKFPHHAGRLKENLITDSNNKKLYANNIIAFLYLNLLLSSPC